MSYKIALAGATSLIGRELKDALTESALAGASFVLLEEAESHGQLDQIGDEVTVVQAIGDDAFEGVDFTFFTGRRELTERYWRRAVAAGSAVLDLSGALEAEPGVLVRSPWLGEGELGPDLLTKAVIPAGAAALSLALILGKIAELAEVRFVAATVMQPASEFGKDGLDELHQQTVSLLSFQNMPQAVFRSQAAFNVLANLGEGEGGGESLSAVEGKIRRHYEALGGGHLPELRLQLLQAPIFHGITMSLCVELDRAVALPLLEDALGGEHMDLVLEETDSPSNVAAVGQNDVLVWLKPEPPVARTSGETSRFWIYAACDNLRLAAQNAVDCALDLRRLRPQGQVQ